jgi:hypothetical protein
MLDVKSVGDLRARFYSDDALYELFIIKSQLYKLALNLSVWL